jgi:hypothetical protein
MPFSCCVTSQKFPRLGFVSTEQHLKLGHPFVALSLPRDGFGGSGSSLEADVHCGGWAVRYRPTPEFTGTRRQ